MMHLRLLSNVMHDHSALLNVRTQMHLKPNYIELAFRMPYLNPFEWIKVNRCFERFFLKSNFLIRFLPAFLLPNHSTFSISLSLSVSLSHVLFHSSFSLRERSKTWTAVGQNKKNSEGLFSAKRHVLCRRERVQPVLRLFRHSSLCKHAAASDAAVSIFEPTFIVRMLKSHRIRLVLTIFTCTRCVCFLPTSIREVTT